MIKDYFKRLYRFKRRVIFSIKESDYCSFRKSIIPDEYIIKVKCTPTSKRKRIIKKF